MKLCVHFKSCIIRHSYLINRNMKVKKVKTLKLEKKNIVECPHEVWLLIFTRLMNKYKTKGNVAKFSLIKKIKLQFL